MDTDIVLTVGILLFVLAIPSLLSAWAEGRSPRIGAILFFLSLGLIATAQMVNPGGYALAEIPQVMLAVTARALP